MRSVEEILNKYDELSSYLLRPNISPVISSEILGQIKIIEWVIKEEITKRWTKINQEIEKAIKNE